LLRRTFAARYTKALQHFWPSIHRLRLLPHLLKSTRFTPATSKRARFAFAALYRAPFTAVTTAAAKASHCKAGRCT
jgi:hypothetical protein